ncbi:Hsp33 family molecular chaperone HslO [Endozoicomonadaceae bacterium StTr2]
MTDNSMTLTDKARRFVFDNTDIRGEAITLNSSLQSALEAHAYPESVSVLLGEMATCALLLSTTLKFEGTMTLQARSEGPVSLLVVECTHNRTFRALARFDDTAALSGDMHELMPKGQLVVTVDPEKGKRYQGIIPMEHETLAGCFETYFQQSEQLPTRLWLSSNGKQAGGLLLQALPPHEEKDDAKREESWNRVTMLANTITAEEQQTLEIEDQLTRLFHEEDVRLFDEEAINFNCTCSRERTGNALFNLERAEVDQILEEEGDIHMDCHFCSRRYTFTQNDVEKLFASHGSNTGQTLH